jgi:hypothetical protein
MPKGLALLVRIQPGSWEGAVCGRDETRELTCYEGGMGDEDRRARLPIQTESTELYEEDRYGS